MSDDMRTRMEILGRIEKCDIAIERYDEHHKRQKKTGNEVLDTINDCNCGASHLRSIRHNLLWVLKMTEEAKHEIDTRIEQVLKLIEENGGVEGQRHMEWLVDQIVRGLVDDYYEWVFDFRGTHATEWRRGTPP